MNLDHLEWRGIIDHLDNLFFSPSSWQSYFIYHNISCDLYNLCLLREARPEKSAHWTFIHCQNDPLPPSPPPCFLGHIWGKTLTNYSITFFAAPLGLMVYVSLSGENFTFALKFAYYRPYQGPRQQFLSQLWTLSQICWNNANTANHFTWNLAHNKENVEGKNRERKNLRLRKKEKERKYIKIISSLNYWKHMIQPEVHLFQNPGQG